ncbi:MAG: hypothetical protein CW338_03090 [Clostridiales bacterium]|nr:hypothetical protein [Clostridiales bacterium]
MSKRERKYATPGLVIFTVVLVLATLIVSGVIIYVKWIGTVEMETFTVSSCSAGADPARFANDRVLMAENSLHGTVAVEVSLVDEDQYEYVFYDVRIRNSNLISAETVELAPVIQADDILCYTAEQNEIVIAPFSSADIKLVVLRNKDAAAGPRQIKITCYYMGEEHEEMLILEKNR